MPRRKTQDVTPRTPTIHQAAGLRCLTDNELYLFKTFHKRKVKSVEIGRGTNADIRIRKDLGVSNSHAALEFIKGNAVQIRDLDSRNGVYVDDRRISTPVVLIVGMEICLGRTKLIATDKHGAFPMWATTVSELCRTANDRHGNYVAAGEHVGRSKDFVRRQTIPRSARYKKFKPNQPAG